MTNAHRVGACIYAGYRWLLIRRHPRTGDLAFYRCYAPQPVTLAALVKTAGLRWTIEENFQAGKGTHQAIKGCSHELTCRLLGRSTHHRDTI
jgi:hypothetical protein